MTGVWEAGTSGCCTAPDDELGLLLCNKAKQSLNESWILGVSVYHIERNASGVGIPESYNLDGGCWERADTVVANEVSLGFLPSLPDDSADE